jgi:hypothetical protein
MTKFSNFLPFLSKIFFYLFCFFFLVTIVFKLSSLFYELNSQNNSAYHTPAQKNELYNPNLSFLNSMPILEKYFLHEIEKKELTQIQAVYFADQLLRERFYHQDRVISISDNWFLHAFNFLSKNRDNTLYTSSLNLNYILESKHAMCNQQALVFQELMKVAGIEYQSVLFNIPSFGHFTSAARVDEQWFFIDTNLEPPYQMEDHSILPRLLNGDEGIFNFLYPKQAVDTIPVGAISASFLNKNPAWLGQLFQIITLSISNYLWLLLFFCYVFCKLLLKRAAVKYPNRNTERQDDN